MNLTRFKFNSFIAIFGLAVAMLAGMLLLSYSLYHFDYDRNVTDPDEWYRVRMDTHLSGDSGLIRERSTFYQNLVAPLCNDMPEVTDFITIWNNSLIVNLHTDGKPLHIERIDFGNPSFLRHYPFRFIYGEVDSILADPKNMIISRTLSQHLFGDENPLGKKIYIGPREDPRYIIQGVFEDLPGNLHQRCNAYTIEEIGEEMPEADENEWYLDAHTRMRIPNPKDVDTVRDSLNAFFRANPQHTNGNEEPVIYLDPITRIHFIRGLEGDMHTMDRRHLSAVLALSGLFLLSALLNFINLVVFTWHKRGSEFSARRALGAGKGDLFAQLVTEYMLRYLLALGIALVLYHFLASSFASLVQLDLSHYTVFATGILLPILGGLLALGVFTGVLVSARFAASSVRTAQQLHRSKSTGNLFILALQIALSAMFIVSGFIVTAQMELLRTRDLGYRHANTLEYHYLTWEGDHDFYTSTRVLIDSLSAIEGVTAVSASVSSVVNESPQSDVYFTQFKHYVEIDGEKIDAPSSMMIVYPGFFENRDIRLLRGEFPTQEDFVDVVVNQCFVDAYMPGQNPVGLSLKFPNEMAPDSMTVLPIRGVVEDAWFYPAYIPMQPMIMSCGTRGAEWFQVSYDPARKGETLARVEEAFAFFSRDMFFGYTSKDIDATTRGFYADETTYNRLMLFCAITIALISAMGVYSISSLYIQEQMRDIAIRKVCGAELRDVFASYARSFGIVLGIASAVGLAVGHMLSTLLLSNFSVQVHGLYRYHLLGLLAVAVIVLVPLWWNIRRAYQVKPFNYLRES